MDKFSENFNEELLLNAKRELYKRSYYEFFKAAVQQLEPQTEWQFNWHIKEACDMLQDEVHRIFKKEHTKNDGLMFNLPPGSAKSLVFSVCLTGWVWIHYPWAKIATNSYNVGLALDHSVKARDLIKTEWYEELYGYMYSLRKDLDSKSTFQNNLGGERKVNAETGKHYDIIVADDLQNPKLVLSDAYRERANTTFFKVLPSRFRNLNYKSLIVVMQRLHIEDICAVIDKKGLKYKKLIVPAEPIESIMIPKTIKKHYNDGSFWPERFSKDVLKQKRTELGSREYNAQYNQTPTPLEGLIYKIDWFKTITNDQFQKILSDAVKRTRRGALLKDPAKELVWNFYVDTSYGDSKTKDGDYTAILCCAVHEGILYVKNSAQVRMEFPELMKFIPDWVHQNGYSTSSRVYIEDIAGGKFVKQTLKKETSLNIIPIPQAESKGGKKLRAAETTAKCEAGNVVFIDGLYLEDLLYQISNFTGDGDSHDDLVDTFIYAIKYNLIKKTGSSEFKMHFV